MQPALDGLRLLPTQADAVLGPALRAVLAEQGAEVVASGAALHEPGAAEDVVAQAGRVDVLVANLALVKASEDALFAACLCSPRPAASWARCSRGAAGGRSGARAAADAARIAAARCAPGAPGHGLAGAAAMFLRGWPAYLQRAPGEPVATASVLPDLLAARGRHIGLF